MLISYTGGCHSERIRFDVSAPATPTVLQCNCSICAKSDYLALIVPAEQFKLLQGGEYLTTYEFHTGTAKHLFCSHCGIKSFYIPRSHPEGIGVNARCLNSPSVEAMQVVNFDGRQWDKQYRRGRAQAYPESKIKHTRVSTRVRHGE